MIYVTRRSASFWRFSHDLANNILIPWLNLAPQQKCFTMWVESRFKRVKYHNNRCLIEIYPKSHAPFDKGVVSKWLIGILPYEVEVPAEGISIFWFSVLESKYYKDYVNSTLWKWKTWYFVMSSSLMICISGMVVILSTWSSTVCSLPQSENIHIWKTTTIQQVLQSLKQEMNRFIALQTC